MTSKREQILSSLFEAIKSLETENIRVFRNLNKSQKISDGMIILRDGGASEPEVILSPLTYIYEHTVTLEVMVQNTDQSDTSLDDLLVSIGNIINDYRDIAEQIEVKSLNFSDEATLGSVGIRIATLQLMIRFSTHNPLN